MAAVATDTIRYHVTGMDCSSCAAKIEGAARKVEGVADVKVSIASQIMTLEVDDPARRLPVVETAITDLGYQLDRVGQPKAEGAGDDDDDDKIPDLSHVTPAYKRALWIVVLLNVGYPGESFNFNTRLLEVARRPELRSLVGEAANDSARYLFPVDSNPLHRWIGQGVRVAAGLYYKLSALYPTRRWSCSPGGLWDFYGRSRDEIRNDLLVWAADRRMQDDSGLCRTIAGMTQSTDQWNAYSSLLVDRLQGFQPGEAAREATGRNSFDPADMKHERTALFIMGTARSETSRTFVGAMAAAVIERFADAHGPLRALVVGEEWGQLYVSNFHEILTLYREGGVNFLGVFQNAVAQIENRYGKETARIWKKAVAHTIYRGLPDNETLRDIEHRSGRTSVMVRGFNVSNSQVNGSGDNLVEQARPLLQVEDVRAATGGETGLLEARDHGFFTVEMPNFWERPEMRDGLRDVRTKPDKYAWLGGHDLFDARRSFARPEPGHGDDELEALMAGLRRVD